jgi:hypothetical protein
MLLSNNYTKHRYDKMFLSKVIFVFRIRRVGHIQCREKLKIHIKYYSQNLKGRENLEELHMDVIIITKEILQKQE